MLSVHLVLTWLWHFRKSFVSSQKFVISTLCKLCMSLFLFISSIPNLKSKKAGGCPGESESHYRSTPVKAFRVDRVWSLFTKVQRLADVQCRNFSVLWISSMTVFTLDYEGLSLPKFGRTIHFLFSFIFQANIRTVQNMKKKKWIQKERLCS